MMQINNLGYETEQEEQATVLAQRLHLELNCTITPCLWLDAERLSLKTADFSPLAADFHLETWRKRQSEGKKQGLVRACKPHPGVKIIDATAGWGRDAAILASFGAQVLMLERNPIMAALLSDALERQGEEDKRSLALTLLEIDALAYLENLSSDNYPDIIYLDPMHPERSKAALVKKDMQLLQSLVGVDEDAYELIELAKKRVKQKVVVKWPQKKPSLIHPASVIPGKTIRFDIYLK